MAWRVCFDGDDSGVGGDDEWTILWWEAVVAAGATRVANAARSGRCTLQYVAQHGFDAEVREVVLLPQSTLWDMQESQRFDWRHVR